MKRFSELILENTGKVPEDYGIKDYEWNNGLLDVHDNVFLGSFELIDLPFMFGKVDGYFICSDNKLTNLYGCPHTVGTDFRCNNNSITSLEYGPKYVGKEYNCDDNKLTDLKGCPEKINFWLRCENSYIFVTGENVFLKSFDGCPKEMGKLICDNSYSPYMKSIEDYPLSIIYDISASNRRTLPHFGEVFHIVRNNIEKFIPLLDDKIAFHQMVMRLNPELIQYYTTIHPPTKKSILYL